MDAQELAIRKVILQVQATVIHRVTCKETRLYQGIERTIREKLSPLSTQEIENLDFSLTIHIGLDKI